MTVEQKVLTPKNKLRRPSLWRRLVDNPVVRKELRGRMRGRRAFVVLTLYLLMLSCFSSILYYAYTTAAQQVYGPDSYLIGKIVFGGVVGVQLLMIIFLTPAFTAGAIAGEKERQTYDLLRTTLLSARALVGGKLVAALSFMILLILAAVPLESMAFVLGGVALEEVVISQLILLVTALALGASSIYFSVRLKNTLGATVVSYVFAFLLTGGLPLLIAILSPILSIFGNTIFGPDEPPWVILAILAYVGGFLLATNPVGTLILSEVVLIEEQTIGFFKVNIVSNHDIWLVSPWTVYVIVYALLAGLAFWLAVRRVHRFKE